MSLYVEGDVPFCGTNNNSGFGNGWEGLIGLALVAGLFDNGNGGGIFGGGNRGGGVGYPIMCGQPASVQDVASGFSTSEIMSDLNDILLGQAQMQNFINQGFAGVNQTVTNGFAGVNNAICTLGYQNQAGFNQIGNLIQSCCCDLKTMNLENRYLNEKQTCDIVNAINAGNQRLIDIYTADKMASKDAKIASLEGQLSNNAQSRYIVDTVLDKLSPCPRPAYLTCNPNAPLNYSINYGNGCNGCCNY